MAGIIYTAVDRGFLITDSPAHVDGTQYSIDVKLKDYIESIETPKTAHVSLGGKTETVLKRSQKVISATFIWPSSENAEIEEWLTSVAAGEVFSFDPYGTIASPDNASDVVYTGKEYRITRISHGSAPWRQVTFSMRYNVE